MSQPLPDLTGAEVKAFRETLGLSQPAFAAQFGISREGVQKQERVGAPGYWRYVFAAVNAGLQPWPLSRYQVAERAGDTIAKAIDNALLRLKGKTITCITLRQGAWDELVKVWESRQPGHIPLGSDGPPKVWNGVPIQIGEYIGDGGFGAVHTDDVNGWAYSPL